MLHMDVPEDISSVDSAISNSVEASTEDCWLDKLEFNSHNIKSYSKREVYIKGTVQEISIDNTDDKIKEVYVHSDGNKNEIADTNIKKSKRNYLKNKVSSVHLQDNGQSSLSTSELSVKNSVVDKVVLKGEENRMVPLSMVITSTPKQSSSDSVNTPIANGKSITHVQSKILTPDKDDHTKSKSSVDGPLSKHRGRNCTKFLTEESTFSKIKHAETPTEVVNRCEYKGGNEQIEGNSSEKSEILMHKNTKGLIAAVKNMGRMQPYVSLNVNDTKKAFEKYFQNKHRMLADESNNTKEVNNSLTENLTVHNANSDLVKSTKGQKDIKLPNQNKVDFHCTTDKDVEEISKNLKPKSKSVFTTGNIVTRSKSSIKQDNIKNLPESKTEKSIVNSTCKSPSNIYGKELSYNCAKKSRNLSVNCKTNTVEGHNVTDSSMVLNMKESSNKNEMNTFKNIDSKQSEKCNVKTRNSSNSQQSHLPQNSSTNKAKRNARHLQKKDAEIADLQKCKESIHFAQNKEPVFQAHTRKPLSFIELFKKYSENSAQHKAQSSSPVKLDPESNQSFQSKIKVTSLNNCKSQHEIDLPKQSTKKVVKETKSGKDSDKPLPYISVKSDVKSRRRQGKNLLFTEHTNIAIEACVKNEKPKILPIDSKSGVSVSLMDSSTELPSRFIKNKKHNDLLADSKKSSKRKGLVSSAIANNELSSRSVENEKCNDLPVHSKKSPKKKASLSSVHSNTSLSSISLENEKYSDILIDSKITSKKKSSVSVVNANSEPTSRSVVNGKHHDLTVCSQRSLKRKALVSIVDSSYGFSSNKKMKISQQSVLPTPFTPLPKEIAVKTLRKNTSISTLKKLPQELNSSLKADIGIGDEKANLKNASLESSKISSGSLAVSTLKQNTNNLETLEKLTDKIEKNDQHFPKMQILNSISLESEKKTLGTVSVLKGDSTDLTSNKLNSRKSSKIHFRNEYKYGTDKLLKRGDSILMNSNEISLAKTNLNLTPSSSFSEGSPIAHTKEKAEKVLKVNSIDYSTNELLERSHDNLFTTSLETTLAKSSLDSTSVSSYPKESPVVLPKKRCKQVLGPMYNEYVPNKLLEDSGALFKITLKVSPAKSRQDLTLGSTGSKDTSAALSKEKPKSVLNVRKRKQGITEHNKHHRYLLPKPSDMNTSDNINAHVLPTVYSTPKRTKSDIAANPKPSEGSLRRPIGKKLQNKISKSKKGSPEIALDKPGVSSKKDVKPEGNTAANTTVEKMELSSSNVPNNLQCAGKPGYYINSMVPAVQYPNQINVKPQNYYNTSALGPTNQGSLALVVPYGGTNILVPLALNDNLPLSAPMQTNGNIFAPISTNLSRNLTPNMYASNNSNLPQCSSEKINIKAVPSKHVNSAEIENQAIDSALHAKFQQEPTLVSQEPIMIHYEETMQEQTFGTQHLGLLKPLGQYSIRHIFLDLINVLVNAMADVSETCISLEKSYISNWFSQRNHLRRMSVRQFCTTPEVMNTFSEHVLRPSHTQNASSQTMKHLTDFEFPESFNDLPILGLIKDFIRFHVSQIQEVSCGILTYKFLSEYPVRNDRLNESVYLYKSFQKGNSKEKLSLKDLVSHLFLAGFMVIFDEFNRREIERCS